MLGFLNCLDRLIAGNCRKSFEEVLQRLSALDVVKQRLGRHAGSSEDGRTVHDFRIPNDRLRHILIVPQNPKWPPINADERRLKENAYWCASVFIGG